MERQATKTVTGATTSPPRTKAPIANTGHGLDRRLRAGVWPPVWISLLVHRHDPERIGHLWARPSLRS